MTRFLLFIAALFTASASAQLLEVSAHVSVASAHKSHANSANVVVWLTPLNPDATPPPQRPQPDYTLAQKDKEFIPHILVVRTGSSIAFPNLDPFFHNVFSLFNGKRFDLGLYEGHTQRSVRFDREGVSYIFCNIHPDMGAIIVSLSTPYFALSAPDGRVVLHGVPAGRYRLNVWAENIPAERLNALSSTVDLTAANTTLAPIHLEATGELITHHLNKFGEPYPPRPKDVY
jgi:plastocyanin